MNFLTGDTVRRLGIQCLIALFALLGPGWLLAQTCAIPGLLGPVALSAVANSYFPGIANANAGNTSISLGLRTGAATDISPGDLLLIIQMQGAEINSTDTNQYGDGAGSGVNENNTGDPARGSVSNIAGQYEFAIATNAASSTGTVNLSAPLTYNYVNAAASGTQGQQRFQVIRVPQYSSLAMSGTIDVTPWDGSSGGVFIVDVAGSLALGGVTINASQRGFRGGGGVNQNPLCTGSSGAAACTEYRSVNANPANGATKGEGIAGSPAFTFNSYNNTTNGSATGADGYPNGDRSRGAPGNAGGGGNQHNAGGGGGGNGGIGGFGGNSWNASNASFEGQRYGGFGGANGYTSATRIIMGGGGGSGDVGGNTSNPAHGGSGGAIVMIRAGTITGNGTINANGANGVQSTGTDASGGAGAGGTIWITTGNGSLPGTLVMTANGGVGANSGPMGGNAETDGPGGGGGGGVLITNSTGGNFTANGGAPGTMTNSSSTVCGTASPNPQCFATAGGVGNTATIAVPVAGTGVRLGHECLPDLRVTKATTTPLISVSGATTAQYTINIQNFGGGARNVVVQDPTLPVAPNWTLSATAPTYQYALPLPLAANNLSSGAEASNTDNGATFPLAATPLTVPAAASNALTWRQFFLAPIKNGVPSSITISFVAAIPAAASVGCYHNAAGVSFLDATRLSTGANRMVTPAANNSANRTGLAYSANSTYASGTASVAGNNYSGLPAGPTDEDVCLQGDLSMAKTAPANVAAGQTLTYTLVATNAGREIRDISFAAQQATTATNAVTPTAILTSGNLRITDTLPASLTVTTAFAGTGWACTQSGQTLTCDRTTPVPVTASAIIGTVTGIVRASNTACPGPLVNTVTLAGFQSPYSETNVSNNSSTFSTTLNCNANLSITKTNNITTLTAGTTTSYLVSATNTGPSSADGAVMRDIPSPGLSSCTVTACTPSGGSPTAVCPLPAQWPNLLLAAGVAIAGFPSGGNISFTVVCNVTATGLP